MHNKSDLSSLLEAQCTDICKIKLEFIHSILNSEIMQHQVHADIFI